MNINTVQFFKTPLALVSMAQMSKKHPKGIKYELHNSGSVAPTLTIKETA